jgi:RHS repeat-associated protein
VRERRSGASAYDITYTYDTVGNRLTAVESGVTTTYSYDEANQLSYDYTPTLRTTYSYDANGNTTLVNAGGGVTTYCWDIENRMMVAELPSGGRTTATYDGDGKRRSYADSAGPRGFLWDGENIARETDGAGAAVAAYSYTPSVYGALLSQRRGGATSFHHYDALGSTMQLTDASQAATDSYLYRAFGEKSVLSGSSPNPFTWVGRLGYYWQPDTSDYWVRARVYGPARGRWVSRDEAPWLTSRLMYTPNSPFPPVDGHQGELDAGQYQVAYRRYDRVRGRSISEGAEHEGSNWYAYAANNPVGYIDPSGLQYCEGHVILRGRFVRNGKVRQEYRGVRCTWVDQCLYTWEETSEADCDCNAKGSYYQTSRMNGWFVCSSLRYYYLTDSPLGMSIPGVRGKFYYIGAWGNCQGHWIGVHLQMGGFHHCTCTCTKRVISRKRIGSAGSPVGSR